MESNTAPLLEMRGIKKDFFGNQVLTDINFTLKAGEVLGLAGENGAGKSTLMKILFGMDVIRETGGYGGDVLINGEKVTFNTPFDALEAGIGMVHQEFSLIPGFTATENILLNREPQKKNVISEVFGPRLNTLDYKKMKDVLDIVSWDNYPSWHKKEEKITAVDVGMQHDLMRSIKKAPFLLMESCPSATNWKPINKLKKPGMLLAGSLQAVAHGSDSVLYFQLYTILEQRIVERPCE